MFRANYARLHGDWRGGGQAGEAADKKINCEGVRKHVTDNKVCVCVGLKTASSLLTSLNNTLVDNASKQKKNPPRVNFPDSDASLNH